MIIASSIGCGALPESQETFSNESPTEAATLEGITTLTFDSDNKVVIQFSDVNEDDQYVIGLYSTHFSTSESYSYSLSSGSNGAALTTQALISDRAEDQTEDFHDLLRGFEGDLEGEEPVNSGNVRALVSALSVGDTRTFKVLNSFSGSSSYDTVTAELRYISSDFYVYVDIRNEEDLTDNDLAELLEPFQNVIDDERDLFGIESDVNGDDHFTILFTQAVNELGGMSGGIVSGFFYAADLYSSSSYPVSNEMEIIYSMVPDPTGEYGATVSHSFAMSNILPSVLPHEFQHMINYNQHVFQNGGTSESSFLNEGLSHLAEDIYSLVDGYMAETGIENPSRVSLYLDSQDSVCFTCGSSISQRGGSYLFVRYLYEQAEKGNLSGAENGADLIDRLLDNSSTGVQNLVEAALGSSSTNSFANLMAYFSAALYLSDTGLSGDNHYNFDGINLQDDQNDNRGTVLEGPTATSVSDFPLTNTLTTSGAAYLTLSGEDIQNAGSVLSITLPSTMQGGGFILKMN